VTFIKTTQTLAAAKNKKWLRIRQCFFHNFESDSGYGFETNVESCRSRLRHSGSVATSESDAPNCFYCPRRDSHCANVDTWHFGQYAHQVFIQYSTSSGNFLVYHVTTPFGTVTKTTPRRRQKWGKETGCEACGEYRSHTDNRQIPTRRRKQVLSYSPSCMLCWRSPSKRAKQLVTTCGEAAICFPRQKSESCLAPCSREGRTLASCCMWHMLLNVTIVGFKFEP